MKIPDPNTKPGKNVRIVLPFGPNTLGNRYSKERGRQSSRGDGAIYDVIYEWIAPAIAKWIATRETSASASDATAIHQTSE